MSRRALTAWILAVPVALAATAAFLWLFGIDLAGKDAWAAFPDDWTVFMLLKHAFAVMLFAGLVRAAKRLLSELWLERPADRPVPLPGDHPDD